MDHFQVAVENKEKRNGAVIEDVLGSDAMETASPEYRSLQSNTFKSEQVETSEIKEPFLEDNARSRTLQQEHGSPEEDNRVRHQTERRKPEKRPNETEEDTQQNKQAKTESTNTAPFDDVVQTSSTTSQVLRDISAEVLNTNQLSSWSQISGTIGSAVFKLVRYSKYFVDKTLLIEQIMNAENAVLLVTAPSRFGKSCNLSMMKEFLSNKTLTNNLSNPDFVSQNIDDTAFKDTKIAKNHDFVKTHFQQYIVINFSLDGTAKDYKSAYECLESAIRSAYKQHAYLEEIVTAKYEKIMVDLFLDPRSNIPNEMLETGLSDLVVMLDKYLNKRKPEEELDGNDLRKIIILVDEYDALVSNCMFSVPEEKLKSITNLRDTIIGNASKDSDSSVYVKLTVLTGVADIYCPRSSPLTNIGRYSFLEPENNFTPYYGISEEELNDLLEKIAQKKVSFENLKLYFNGYKWGNILLYNTWSVMEALNHGVCKPYFALKSTVITEFQKLLRCEKFYEMIGHLLNYQDIDCAFDLIHNPIDVSTLSNLAECIKDSKKEVTDLTLIIVILYQNGWLTRGSKINTVKVPNVEIRKEIIKIFLAKYFENTYGFDMGKLARCGSSFTNVIKPNFDVAGFCKDFHALCFKPSKKTTYQMNHALLQLLMLMVSSFSETPCIYSGVESSVNEKYQGSLRCDNVFYSESHLVIVELKYNDTVKNAMQQIMDKNYMNIEKNEKIFVGQKISIDYTSLLGIAVCDKTVKKTSMKFEFRDKERKNLIVPMESSCEGVPTTYYLGTY